MFSKLKGAIDYVDQRFQEEQARARAAQGQITRSSSTARKTETKDFAQSDKNALLDSQQRDGSSKGLDPNEFDADVVAEDESGQSQSGTPGPARVESTDNDTTVVKAASFVEAPDTKLAGTNQDIRAKLRKLEKLESKYQELLRSYRIAHARVSSIEPFEAALKENTPLASINDPTAFTEYLNQVHTKGDMVLEELKRVTNENGVLKQKLKDAEEEARMAWDEISLPKTQDVGDNKRSRSMTARPASVDNQGSEMLKSMGDGHSPQTKARSGDESESESKHETSLVDKPRKPSLSPQLQIATEKRSSHGGSEDLFSYDIELPKVEAELKQSQDEVSRLLNEVDALQDSLKSTEVSAASMARELESMEQKMKILQETQNEDKRVNKQLVKELEAADAKCRLIEYEKSSKNTVPSKEHELKMKELGDELVELQSFRASVKQKSKKIEELELELENKDSNLEKERTEGNLRLSTSSRLIEELKEQLNQAKTQLESCISDERMAERTRETFGSVTQDQNLGKACRTTDSSGRGQLESNIERQNVSKKSSKKKKKGVKSVPEPYKKADENANLATGASTARKRSDEIELELEKALMELRSNEATIQSLKGKLEEQHLLQEEIDFLRDELRDNGQNLIDAKERIKELEIEKAYLRKEIVELQDELIDAKGSHASVLTESEKTLDALKVQFEDLRNSSKSLETDLSVAQQLASSRFKDLSEIREKMQKVQPEIKSLKAENEDMKKVKKELEEKRLSYERLNIMHGGLQTQISELKGTVNEKDKEITGISSKLGAEMDSRQKLESESRKLKGDLSSTQSEARNALQSLERVSGELTQARQVMRRYETRIREMEDNLRAMEREESRLKEDIELKSAQYASAESLMSSMRDQTAEMATQLKEVRERCDSLDEEAADTHRLLSERTREGETMRRLLAEVETRTDSRIRDMKDRMDIAIEERERIEDEASASSRRRAREMEESRNKLREVEQDLKLSQGAREDLENAQRDWRRRREELEQFAERNKVETEEAKTAMGRIRDALDESERQARSLETQKLDLRQAFEESKNHVERLEKQIKALQDETKQLQSRHKSNPASDSSSILRAKAKTTASAAQDALSSAKDEISQTAYLKNILLQFLEMKEKKHQVQFVPTLATLLQLNSTDQQKWTAAIMSK